MSYKIAGIDVHKKVLMVVVMDASTPESKPERRRFTTMPSDLHRLLRSLSQSAAQFNGQLEGLTISQLIVECG